MSDIFVIGEDKRMDYIAQTMYDYGYEVYRDLETLTYNSVVILPPKMSSDMENNILKKLNKTNIIFFGAYSDNFINECKNRELQIKSYFDIEQVVSDNAILTAKGIIKEALADGAVLEESACLVLGFGHCGKAIAAELKNIRANVEVMVRKKENKSIIEEYKYEYKDLNNAKAYALNKYSYIFNTIPALVIDRSFINQLSENVMIFDIASYPGGVDFDYCSSKNIYFMHSLGIPGKEYPSQAGKIIADAIYSYIN